MTVNTEKLLKIINKSSSKQLTKDAIKEILPNRINKWQNIFVFVITIIIGLLISCKVDTVLKFKDLVEIFNGVDLVIIAVVFTGFTFFEAVVTDDVLKRLASYEKNDKTFLQIHYEYFIHIIMLVIWLIFFNIIIIAILSNINQYFILFDSIIVDTIIAFIGISIYTYVSLTLVIETKSFIFNLYQIYVISKVEKIREMIKNNELDGK